MKTKNRELCKNGADYHFYGLESISKIEVKLSRRQCMYRWILYVLGHRFPKNTVPNNYYWAQRI